MTVAIPPKLVDKFRVLAAERLSRLSNAVVALEQSPGDAALTTEARRELHTLKGDARILGFQRTVSVAHIAEELMALAVEGGFADREVTEALLAGFDLLAEVADRISTDGEPDVDMGPFERRCESLSVASGPGEGDRAPSGAVRAGPRPRPPSTHTARAVRVEPEDIEHLTQVVGELRTDQAALNRQRHTVRDLVARLDRLQRLQALGGASGSASPEGLDGVDLQGLRNELHRLQGSLHDTAFEHQAHLEQLSRSVTRLRLVPLSDLFAELPRAVRDMAGELGKQVHLEVLEGDVAVDRQVQEALAEPLTHLLRNAIDHGLESPQDRRAAGKGETGTIRLQARLVGSRAEIRIEDDGQGIAPEVVRQAAVERRVLGADAAAELSDEALYELLFAPGFTTRAEASEYSGRGIGLDVAQQRIIAVGGSVHLSSEVGKGTTFVLDVPVAVALSRALVVEAAGSTYALDSTTVAQVCRLDPDQIERVGEGLVARMDGVPIPLVDLAAMLHPATVNGPGSGERPVVVLAHRGKELACWVDRLVGDVDVVQRRVGAFLRSNRLIHRTAMLKDGRVAIALSLTPLFELAVTQAAPAVQAVSAAAPERPRILVVDDSELTRDLMVNLLREHDYDVVEAVNGREALERLAQAAPQMIITDLEMPVLDGFELIRQVRASQRFEHIPVMVFSTLGSAEDKRQAAQLGADGYVVKSDLHTQTLLRQVSRFLQSGRSG